MAVSPNSIITPQAAYTCFADLTNMTTAITGREPKTVTTNMVPLVPSTGVTDGLQIYSITVKGASTSGTAATNNNIVTIWEYDGTSKYWPVEEITVVAITPSTTVPAFTTTIEYDRWIISPGHTLWASVSVATATATTALMAYLEGAKL